MNILITSASSKVLLVKEFILAAKKHGIKVYTSDLTSCAAGFFGDGHFILPRLKEEARFEDEILDLCMKNNIGLIVPTRDEDLIYFSIAKTRFKENGIEVLVANEKSIDTCIDKRKFYTFLTENKMSPIPILSPPEIKDCDFPIFVRPTIGSGGRGCFLAKKLRDIEELDFEQYLFHPYISAKEYSIDVLMDLDGKAALQSVCRERIIVNSGESKISKITRIKEVETISENICSKLELVGHNVIQVFYNDGNIMVIEANARFGGASNLSIKAGLDSADRIVRMFLGDMSARINKDIRSDLIMYRFSEDYICEPE